MVSVSCVCHRQVHVAVEYPTRKPKILLSNVSNADESLEISQSNPETAGQACLTVSSLYRECITTDWPAHQLYFVILSLRKA